MPQVPEGRLRTYPRTGFSRPSGTEYGERGAFPTTEVLGYCQMSLRDMKASYLMQIRGSLPGFLRYFPCSP